LKVLTKLDYVLVCEDIRLEIGRKPSAMGIFTDNIIVRSFPYVFPKLCFLIHMFVKGPGSKLRLSSEFKYTGQKPLVLIDGQEVAVEKDGGLSLNLAISPCKFEAPGAAEFILRADGRIYRKRFSVSRTKNIPES